MKTNLTISTNRKTFQVEVEVNESGRGTLTLNGKSVPCQLTKNTMDQINWGIWNTIICGVSNLTNEHGQVVGENGKSVLEVDVLKMY